MGWLASLFGTANAKPAPGAAAATLPPPAEAYLGLRKLVLGITAEKLGMSALPGGGDVVLALLMENVHPGAVVTLAGMADGTTSLYFSNGGGIIGSGGHAPVAAATRGWLEAVEQFRGTMTPTSEFPFPAAGRVRFYLVTSGGVRTADADEKDLQRKRDPLWPLYFAAHGVITQVRRHAPTPTR
jgi:hypothetical protein